MFCTQCRSQLAPGADFCGNCGQKVKPREGVMGVETPAGGAKASKVKQSPNQQGGQHYQVPYAAAPPNAHKTPEKGWTLASLSLIALFVISVIVTVAVPLIAKNMSIVSAIRFQYQWGNTFYIIMGVVCGISFVGAIAAILIKRKARAKNQQNIPFDNQNNPPRSQMKKANIERKREATRDKTPGPREEPARQASVPKVEPSRQASVPKMEIPKQPAYEPKPGQWTEVLIQNNDGGSTAEEPLPSIEITITCNNVSKQAELKSFPCVLGRSQQESNIILEDSSVSRKHATIDFLDGEFVVTDNNSSNGTVVNGVKLDKGAAQPLCPEDTIKIGRAYVQINSVSLGR